MNRFQHRLNVYGRRVLRAALGKGLRRRCLFLHMPKCGGTALAEGLYGTVGIADRVGVIDALSTRRAAAVLAGGRDELMLCHEDLPQGHLTFALRERIALSHIFWTTRLIHGHVLATDRLIGALDPSWALVTMMRDPAQRALSNYRMAVSAGVIPADLDAWLDGPVGVSMARVYLRYLSGQTVIPDEQLPAALAAAHQRLARFDVIGFLDEPAAFGAVCARALGVRPHLPRRNLAKGLPVTLSPEQMDRLHILLAPDREIYRAARALHLYAATAKTRMDRARSAADSVTTVPAPQPYEGPRQPLPHP